MGVGLCFFSVILYRLSEGFWGEALVTSCHILNRVLGPIGSSYELWYKKSVELKLPYMVWGCRAIVRLPNNKRKKLGK